MRHPFLIGRRIYLRRIERGDLEGKYFQWLNDQEVTRWMQNGIFPNSMESMEQYYESQATSRTNIIFAIVLKDCDRHIGNIGLHNIHNVFRSAEIGIVIGEKDCWGQGIATEAISLLVRHAFLRMNLNRLSSGAVLKNPGSIRAFEKAGYVREGLLRQAYYCEGTYVDCICLAILKSEWMENKQVELEP